MARLIRQAPLVRTDWTKGSDRFRDGGGRHIRGVGRTPQPRGFDVRPPDSTTLDRRFSGADITTPRLWRPPNPAVVASAPITKSPLPRTDRQRALRSGVDRDA